MHGRSIVVGVVLLGFLALFAGACRGGGTSPSPVPVNGSATVITLAQLERVEPSVPEGRTALSYIYGQDTVTAHFKATINPLDSGPNLIVMACLGTDKDTYVSGGCRGKGSGALSSGAVEGVTLDPAYGSGSQRISTTAYVHVFVVNASAGQMNNFYTSLSGPERDLVPLKKLRESGLLLSEPSSASEPIDWRNK